MEETCSIKVVFDVMKYRIKPDEAYIRINGWAFVEDWDNRWN